MTAARSLQEAFDWTPEPASSRRKPSRLAEHASAWMERAAELGLSESQAVVLMKSGPAVLSNVGGRWRWGGGKPFALTSTVRAMERRGLLGLPWRPSIRRDDSGRPVRLGWSRGEKSSGYVLTRLGMQAAMWLRGEGVERPEVPR